MYRLLLWQAFSLCIAWRNREKAVISYVRGVKYPGYSFKGKCKLSVMKQLVARTDEWLRRRIRMCIWKSWKKTRTKMRNLVKCGIDQYKAYQWGNTRLGYWRVAGSPILSRAISNQNLKRAGYTCLSDEYAKWIPKRGTAVCRTARPVV